MAPISIADIVSALPSEDEWGPPTPSETTLEGVPYAPFSKGDKLGRMADWTSEGKDRERGGRQAYNRNYRGEFLPRFLLKTSGMTADPFFKYRSTSIWRWSLQLVCCPSRGR